MNHTYDHQCSCPICLDNERRIREIMKEEKARDAKSLASLSSFFKDVRVMVQR
jgi:recombinational DNA repair protein RecR